MHSCDPLTPEEREKIEAHPSEGADILAPLERFHPGITRVVQAHHEFWNGKGYPCGLEREQIPLAARIISVADVFDALTQPRPYHEPVTVEEARERIRNSAGVRFDPEVVQRSLRGDIRARWDAVAREGREREREVLGAGGAGRAGAGRRQAG